MENWKIVKCNDAYEVSNLGNIRNIKTKKLKKPYLNEKGYLILSLWKNCKPKSCRVHRLVAEAFLPNPNNLPQVNHKDENKTNNNVENLEWCDNEYNNNYGTINERRSFSKKNIKN